MRIMCSLSASIAVITLLAAAASRGAEAAAARAGAPLEGINIGFSLGSSRAALEREIVQARGLDARIVRVAIPWSAFEPERHGRMRATALADADRLVRDAAAHGMRVLMMVYDTPCWASSAPARELHSCAPGHKSAATAWPPRTPATYASFVSFLARRYGTKLAALEIWNEPDLADQSFFAGPEKPQRYARLVRAAYTAIKRAEPHVPVLAGSLVGSNGRFLEALYAAGMKGYYDGLAVHFYTLTLAALRNLHKVQLRHGDHRPLWLDEFGWSSCLAIRRTEEDQPCVTAKIQAQNLRNTVRSLSRTPWVAATVTYGLQDGPIKDFGVLDDRGKPKPAFYALREAFRSPFGPVERVTLRLSISGDRVRASGTAPVGDYLELQAYRGSTERYRGLFTLNRFNRYSVRLPAALGTSDLRVKVFRYWDGSGSGAETTI